MDALWQVLFPDLFIFNSCFLASYLFYFSLLLFLYKGTSSEQCHWLHFVGGMRNADGQTGAVFLLVKSGWARCPVYFLIRWWYKPSHLLLVLQRYNRILELPNFRMPNFMNL